ncbi:Hsp20/alpha crystallin family protein [bacterium]|nr:Hsp20/alpha crystallin family protein [bacterium]
MTKKLSFLEKLTGASSTKELEESEEKSKSKKERIVKKNYSEKKSKKEKWITEAEAEGQLTIDVYQTTNDIVIKSTIAGVKPEDLDISITNDMVTIKGRRDKDEKVKPEDYYYQECYWGPFSRSVILPVDIEADKAKATMKNGILTIRLPKAEKVKTRKIVVKGE